ncbi:MAG TPA: multiheme c-type cytochrome [Polyangia bacterium]|nr:multiheme c-type cytochrome [Polyangia bacterium]
MRARLASCVFLATFACSQKQAPRPPAPPVPAPVVAPAPPAPVKPALAIIATAGWRGRLASKDIPPPPNDPPRNLGLRKPTKFGLGRRATIVDRARVETATLQLDAGDFLPLPTDDPRDAVAPTPKDFGKWRGLALEGLHRLGVDAVTFGARELAQPGLDARKVAALLDKAHVPVVLANLVDDQGAPVLPVDKLIDAKGTSVGVFGVAELAGDAAALKKAHLALGDAAAAAHARAADLRARGAKLVVALVNAPGGRARAEAIVAGADVDLVIAAGGQEPSAALSPSAARPFVAAPPGGYEQVERIDVRMPLAFDAKVVALGADVPEQVGVGLIAKVETIHMFNSDQLIAEAKRKNKLTNAAMLDIYEPWEYASTKTCGYCHEKQVAQWKTTDHAHAFATLTAKHDQDHTCLGCHVIGFLQPGGSRDIIMARTQFVDVGCEACHGPSTEHVRSVNKKKGTSRKVSPTVCLGCHTPDWSPDFDPVAAMKEILGPGHGRP